MTGSAGRPRRTDPRRAGAVALTPARWSQVKALVHAALAEPAAERAAFLAEVCSGDAELRDEVASLVAAASDDGDSLPGVRAAVAAAACDGDAQGAMGDGPPNGAPPARADRLAAALADRYVVERVLGRGGMATVYLARDVRHRRRVALKVLEPGLAAALGTRRFLREIETSANLSHPHVLPLYDSGDADGLPYYVMPYVPGGTLRDRLAQRAAGDAARFPIADVVRCVREVADALDYAHRRGVVHRDVKPENILLGEGGHALVADFGVARAIGSAADAAGSATEHAVGAVGAVGADDGEDDEGGGAGASDGDAGAADAALTGAGMVVGTPAYMSPEQSLGGGEVTGASDQYALACVAYELLAGTPAFPGSGDAIRAQRPSDPPPALAGARSDVPAAADAVLATALARAPERRFASAGTFAESLAAALGAPGATSGGQSLDGASSRAAHAPHVAPRRWSRRVAVAAVVGSALMVTALAAARHAIVGATSPERAADAALPTDGAPRRIAVLPFAHVGPPAEAYLAAGVTEEVSGRLGRVPGLGVISRTSADQFRAATRPLAQVGAELGVAHVLEGSVQWERRADGTPERVRVTARLIRVSDDVALWSERYDAPAADVFHVQAEIAERVAAALDVALDATERRTLAAIPTRSLRAYELYLQAAEMGRNAGRDRAALERVVSLYDEAIALDSSFAPAYALLSIMLRRIYMIDVDGDHSPTARRTIASAERAVRLDPSLPDAHVALGEYQYWFRADLDSAAAALSTALRLQPGHPQALVSMAWVRAQQGRYGDGLAMLQRAAALNPRASEVHRELAQYHSRLRDHASAARHYARAAVLEPDGPRHQIGLASIAFTLRGDTAAFRHGIRTAVARFGPTRVVPLAFSGTSGMGHVAGLDRATVVALDRDVDASLRDNQYVYREWKYMVAEAVGSPAALRAQSDSLRRFAEQRAAEAPEHPAYPCLLALAYARLDRARDARLAIERCLARTQGRADSRTVALGYAARAYAVLGQRDATVRAIRDLLAQPSPMTVPILRLDPVWRPLHDHPDIGRLLADADR